jgi:hypothetical protein
MLQQLLEASAACAAVPAAPAPAQHAMEVLVDSLAAILQVS